jgi:FkbM family methyltransferase
MVSPRGKRTLELGSSMIGLPQSLRHVKRAFHILRGRDLCQRKQLHRDSICLGSAGASWCVCPHGLSASSIVYSMGVGEEISFDLELIRRFGVRVHAFDPTPRSIEWLAKQSLPGNFLFHPYGVAGFDGHAKFLPPVNPAHISHTLVERQTPWPAMEVPVRRLCSIMQELGHQRIDLLKMDIEGAEYAVLKDLLASRISVHQLLVEFHHRWPEIGVEETRQAIRDLNSAGYRIFDVSPSGEEYGFLRVVGC